jgi:hypothetical protein
MAKNKVRKSVIEKRKKIAEGKKRHEQNIYRSNMKKAKKQLEMFMELEMHRRNTTGAKIDEFYGQ